MATMEQEQQRLFRAVWRLEISLRKVLKRTPICTILFLTPILYLLIDLVCEIVKN